MPVTGGQAAGGQAAGGQAAETAAGNPVARWHADWAWVAGRPVRDVLFEVADGRFQTVAPGTPPPPAATRLRGLTLPGFADAHSHAFHRALRGRTHGTAGSFWSWRTQMYAVADRLDPDTYTALATAVYGELAAAGVTCVGEFHYLHHRPDGRPYDDPNAMATALTEAAARAGVRLTLLDACYLTGDVDGAPPTGTQQRFTDGSAEAWADRVARLRPDGQRWRLGAAVHSVRAVPPAALPVVAEWAAGAGAPVHVHLSEQPAENDACRRVHGCTPTALLARHGVLGPRTTTVHGTHLSAADRVLLADAGAGVCLCPTTERELADGIGPAADLAAAGVPLSLGSDSHAVVDPFEDARAVELHTRLQTHRRGWFSPGALVTAATAAGHQALGWDDAGTLTPGSRADLVTVAPDSVRTAGTDWAGVMFTATAADVTDVVVDGRTVVRDRRHQRLDVPAALHEAISLVVGEHQGAAAPRDPASRGGSARAYPGTGKGAAPDTGARPSPEGGSTP